MKFTGPIPQGEPVYGTSLSLSLSLSLTHPLTSLTRTPTAFEPRRRASCVAVNCHSHCIRSASRLAQTATPKFVSCHPLRPTFPLPSAWSRRRMKFREHIHNRLASRRAAVIRRPRRAAYCSTSTRELPGRRSSSTSTCLSFVPPSSTCSGSAAAPKRCHPCGGCGQPEYVADALHRGRDQDRARCAVDTRWNQLRVGRSATLAGVGTQSMNTRRASASR